MYNSCLVSVAYNPVKTRLWWSEAQRKKQKNTTLDISARDSENLVLTEAEMESDSIGLIFTTWHGPVTSKN